MISELEHQRQLFLNFPTPPVVALRIIEISQNPDVNIKQVSDVFARDPGLAVKLLRVANSALYSHLHRSESLTQALIVLGLNASLTLGLSFSLLNSLKTTSGLGLDYTLFWRRSLIASVAAKSMGEALKEHALEELLLAGLIQDVGMLALARAQQTRYLPQLAEQFDHKAIIAYEERLNGVSHAEVGAWLLKSWNLSDRIVNAVAGSHGKQQTRETSATHRFNSIIAFSGHIADALLGQDPQLDSLICCPVTLSPLFEKAERLFGLSRARFEGVITRTHMLVPPTTALFDLQAEYDAQGLALNARLAITNRNLNRARSASHPSR